MDDLTPYATPHAAAHGHPSSTLRQLDDAVTRVRAGAARFASLPLAERIALAATMQQGYLDIAEMSVHAGCTAKGLDFASPQSAEEWATGPWCVVRQLRLVREQLAAIASSGNTRIGPASESADGRLQLRLFPGNAIDGLLFQGCQAEARLQHGMDSDTLEQRRARFYRGGNHGGRTVLVLGAGNIAAIGPMDVVSKMFNEGKACVLKMNPVNAYLGPFIERAFAAAIERGFLAVVYGGAEEGSYLAQHPDIDEIHLTGSDRTHDAIVWGPAGAAREARQRLGSPLSAKPISAELGNVSPVLLVPGPYTDRELAYQAQELASAMVMNAGFLCNAPRVLVTPQGWDGRSRFLQLLRQALATVPPRRSYYPGAVELWQALAANRPGRIEIGQPGPGTLPWTLLPDLDAVADEPLFAREAFCPILAETSLGSADPLEFLERAVDFANARLWGTLSATLVVHPRLMRDPATAAAVERAIARLRYGTVSVNAFPGLSFAFGAPPWGAYPGAIAADIQSGRGWVHNTAMLEGIEKAVLRFPLTMFPKPVYFPGNRTARRTAHALVRLDQNARWARLPAVMWHAMRG